MVAGREDVELLRSCEGIIDGKLPGGGDRRIEQGTCALGRDRNMPCGNRRIIILQHLKRLGAFPDKPLHLGGAAPKATKTLPRRNPAVKLLPVQEGGQPATQKQL